MFLFLHKTQISHNYISIPSLPNFPPLPSSQPSRSSQSLRLGFLCHTAASHQLPLLHMVLYKCWRHFPVRPTLSLPTVSTVHSLYLRYMCVCIYIHNGELLSIKNNKFESLLVRWINLEPVIQSEISQKEKNKSHILTHIYGIQTHLWGRNGVLPYRGTNPIMRTHPHELI